MFPNLSSPGSGQSLPLSARYPRSILNDKVYFMLCHMFRVGIILSIFQGIRVARVCNN